MGVPVRYNHRMGNFRFRPEAVIQDRLRESIGQHWLATYSDIEIDLTVAGGLRFAA